MREGARYGGRREGRIPKWEEALYNPARPRRVRENLREKDGE